MRRRIEYIQDLPRAARRLLDSERVEGVPVSSFQERLCTLWQRGKKYMQLSWFLLDESELPFDHQFRHRICNLGRLTSPAFFQVETKNLQLVTLLMPNTKNLCSQNSFGR